MTSSNWVMVATACVIATMSGVWPVAESAAAVPAAQTADTHVVEDPAYAKEGEQLGRLAAEGLVGQAAPAVSVTTIDGEKIDLSALYGKKPVYLKFWATWCVPCRQQMPGFEKIYDTLGDQIQVVAVDIGFNDDVAAVRAYRQKLGLHMPIVFDDGSLGALFNLRVTPQHVLIGRDGRIAYVGHLEDARLDAALHQVLAEPASQVAAVRKAGAGRSVIKPGDTVGGLHTTTDTGLRVALGGKSRRPRAVVFFSTWCESYLEKSRPGTSKACRRVREDVDRLADKGDVEWIGIAGGPWSTSGDLADYRSANKVKIPLALDAGGTLFRAFGVRDIPTIALIDEHGRLRRIIGPDDTDIAGAIRDALSVKQSAAL